MFGREDLLPFGALLRSVGAGKAEPSVQDIALTGEDREFQLAAVATALRFTLSAPGVHTAIVGTSRPGRFEENARHLERRLAAREVAAIRQRWLDVAERSWVGQT